MNTHFWVKHVLTPVTIDEHGQVMISESALRTAEEAAVYGCGICDMPLAEDMSNLTEECIGVPAEQQN